MKGIVFSIHQSTQKSAKNKMRKIIYIGDINKKIKS